MNDETALVQSNKFDLLIQKIEQKKEEAARYEIYQKRLRVIFRRITSVYFFLRKKMNMPMADLSLEDFEVAEEKLSELAKEKANDLWHKFWRKLGLRTAWQYYHEFGFFNCRSTPLGYWYFSATGYDWHNIDNFDAEYLAARFNGLAIPPNARILLIEIYKKESESDFQGL